VDSSGRRITGHNAVLALLSDTPALSLFMPVIAKLSVLFRIGYFFSYLLCSLLPLEYMLSSPQYSLPSARRGAVRIPPSLRKIRALDIVVVVLTLYVAWWNVGVTYGDWEMPGALKTIGTAVRLDQNWNMFAPYPMKDDGWYIIPARLANGKEVDLFHNGDPVSYDKPTYVSKSYEDSRWRRYMMNLWSVSHQDKRLFFWEVFM